MGHQGKVLKGMGRNGPTGKAQHGIRDGQQVEENLLPKEIAAKPMVLGSPGGIQGKDRMTGTSKAKGKARQACSASTAEVKGIKLPLAPRIE